MLFGFVCGNAAAAENDVRLSRDYTAATVLAKKAGIPILLIFGDTKSAEVILTPAEIKAKCRHVVVACLSTAGAGAKKLEVTSPAVMVANSAGEPTSRLAIDVQPAELLKALDAAITVARDAVLPVVKDEDAADAARKAAIDTLARLGTGAEALVPLLAAKKPAIQSAAQTALASMGVDAAAALFDGLASEDGDLRAACLPLAAKATKYALAGTAAFWRTGAAGERSEALAKWRRLLAENELCRKVVEFCFANLGKQVGGGECSHLAKEAIQSAGARPGDFSDQSNYIWGRLLGSKDEVQPGDILQMENAEFRSGGAFITAAHHTAVIVKVVGPGNYEALEQNVGGRRTVGPGKFNMATMKKGTAKFYRPVPQ